MQTAIMNKILILFITVLFSSALQVSAQSFTAEKDTVYATVSSDGEPLPKPYDSLTNKTAYNLTLRWRVKDTNFPADWLTPAVFGICDNYNCLNNLSNFLWNPATSSGRMTSAVYQASVIGSPDSTDAFSLSMSLRTATTIGTYWVTVTIADSASPTTKDITFVLNRPEPNKVKSALRADEELMLYPNPANNELNVVFDANAGIRNIVIYNFIGKMMKTYNVGGNSANLDIESMPAGIYFLKLYNGNGNTVATMKFTKQ